ncbi:MAG: glycolate oxidase subunit GlcE [Steroidobacteraceae bacterium]|jgi:glycolate oxidase FAD binding subunit
MDQAVAAISERIRAAATDRTALRVRAGGSKDFYGNTPHGALLDPRAVRGIVAYDPSELSIAVRCGTPLAQLEAVLEERGQMLAFEPPHFGAHATIGGCVATGLAGPRRAANGYCYGGVRDFVLGAKLLDGQGQLLSFGGMVMKNVAGYDLARLLTGSLGVLGVLVEVALKVVPKPRMEATLRIAMDEATALAKLNEWGAQPWPISASAWQAGTLCLRLSGSAAAVNAARSRLPGESTAQTDAAAFWQGIKEHTAAFFLGDAPLWRLSLPSTAEPLKLDDEQMIEWGGALRWLRCGRPAAEIRSRAQALGGHATLFRGGDRSQGVFMPLSPALTAIHRRLRAHFDPAAIFDAGRMFL